MFQAGAVIFVAPVFFNLYFSTQGESSFIFSGLDTTWHGQHSINQGEEVRQYELEIKRDKKCRLIKAGSKRCPLYKRERDLTEPFPAGFISLAYQTSRKVSTV